MAWNDGVPWAIGGGSEIDAEIGRLIAWKALNGQEGIFTAGDLHVDPLVVPGASIRVSPGACGILNRALGARSEAYIGRLPSEDVIGINPTGGGSGRSDLVIARVENPYISGEPWAAPSDVAHGPYIFTRVIENVAPTVKSVHSLNLGYSAITLARVDIPPSTGTIIASYVKDLRTLVNQGTGGTQPPVDGGDGDDGGPVVVCPGGTGDDGDNDDGDKLPVTQTTLVAWPFTAAINVDIPVWANFADIDIEIQNVQVRSGSLFGFLRMILGGLALSEQPFAANWPGATCRQHIPLHYANTPIPAAIRGTTQAWHLEARMLAAIGGSGKLISTKSTKIKYAVTFKQRPSDGT